MEEDKIVPRSEIGEVRDVEFLTLPNLLDFWWVFLGSQTVLFMCANINLI